LNADVSTSTETGHIQPHSKRKTQGFPRFSAGFKSRRARQTEKTTSDRADSQPSSSCSRTTAKAVLHYKPRGSATDRNRRKLHPSIRAMLL
jgi:hypothetical protein